MLFVGSPDNEPLTSQQVASLMRGVRPQEVAELVEQLNARYQGEGCPYHVCSVGSGYRLLLRDEYASLRDKFYGRVREARLSQPALDVLAVVAYRQPLTRQEVDELRGHPSGAILSQLVRRQLLRIERPEDNPRQVRYFTTDRFLDLFGLEGLAELPQTHDLDKLL
jgi:segregation and condensation protein B